MTEEQFAASHAEDIESVEDDLDRLEDPDARTEVRPDRAVDRFRRSSAGAVLAAGMFGLRDALEGRPESDDIEIVGTAPAADDRYSITLDPEHPERSVVVVHRRPC